MTELDRIDMISDLMAERRKEMIKVRNWRGDRQELARIIEESNAAEDKLQEKETMKLGEESTKRRSGKTRRWQERRWGDPAMSHGEVKGARRKASAWEQRKRKQMQMWEAPPPGPPPRWRQNWKR